jgi:putative flippase GtrA
MNPLPSLGGGKPATAVDAPPRGALATIATLARHRVVRFFAVGALNTAFAYGLFAALVLVGLHYPIASLVATVIGILFSFQTIGRLVFGSHDVSLIFRFLFVYGIVWLVGVLLLGWAERLGISVLVAAAVLTVPIGLFSFLLQRLFVFRGRR